MRATRFFLSTLKEAPAEAELPSHRLMLRAGLIKRLSNGLYTWMPLGLRVLRKVEAVVREEMNRAGAIELSMPVVQPAELWQESQRWYKFGPEMLRFKDRHERDFLLGPTHEEVITDIARKEIRSYRQLPVNFYQIQTKFRDETRPRFGVMRAREFLMKDAYSFHADRASLEQTYQVMYDAYTRIFTRLGLKFRAVAADTGSIGGSGSHEFHVLADSGEDAIAYSLVSGYAANIEMAEAKAAQPAGGNAQQPLEKVATPGRHSIEEVCAFLKVAPAQTVKTLIVEGDNGRLAAVLLRGDHELNEVKLKKVKDADGNNLLGDDFLFADEKKVREATGAGPGSVGPVGLTAIPVIADRSVALMENFAAGANTDGFHYIHVSFARDVAHDAVIVADVRNVVAGDPSPDGEGELALCRGIEVGHIFQLGKRYSEAMQAAYLDENGQTQIMEMGCYGIGVSRVVGAAIEQYHDARGILFPAAMAPFTVAIAPIGYGKSEAVREAADSLYQALAATGVDVLLDDRDERPGVMFADLDLIGIPHRVTIGDRGLKDGLVEYKARDAAEPVMVDLRDIANRLESLLGA